MIKILIIDDEKRTRDLISKMILSYDLPVQTIVEGESVETGIQAIETYRPDLVLLDIQMPDGTGFDVIKGVEYKNFEVIFVTAHEEYAIKAIKFSALDYILKPVDPEELNVSIQKALHNIENKNSEQQFDTLNHNSVNQSKRKLVLKTSESVFVVDLSTIIRCESDRNYTNFYLDGGNKIMVSKTLKEYEMLLSGNNFMRVAQSHIINLFFVDRYDRIDGGTVVMKDGSQIPLSHSKRDIFFRILENL
ncbi:MAG: LytTR family DNA-binding domain-containing protein [Bacteroidetes bacterium]|nr:LytTR family DNA-binding domain-containing protein [Bacteroidota bacterium]